MLKMEGVAPLNLLKEQVDTTLNDIEESVRDFLEDHEDTASLQHAKELLGQLRGVFNMIEFKEALLMTSDLQVALALVGSLQSEEEQEPLITSIGQSLFVLSHYLSFVHARQRALPVLLVPSINELRRHLGLGLVSELDFCRLNIPMQQLHERPPTHASPADLAKIPTRAKRLRHMYQVGLLGVIREQSLQQHFSMMERAIDRLTNLTGDVPLAQLWWVAKAVLQAFTIGDVRLTTARKVVLSKIDRQIKRLVYDGLPVVNETMPTDLLRECLYIITLSNKDSDCVAGIKASFGIEQVGMTDEQLKTEAELMNGPGGSVIGTVASHMCEELSHVKDILDDAARGSPVSNSQMTEVAETLSKIALSMGMLGSFKAGTALRDQTLLLSEANENPEAKIDFVQLADSILFAEQSLKVLVYEHSKGMAEESTTVKEHAQLEQNEDNIGFTLIEEAHVMVVVEARQGLVEVKKQLNLYLDEQFDASHLQKVPDTFHGVSGALTFLRLDRAAAVVLGCKAYVQNKLIYKDGGKDPSHFEIETLADTLSSLDYYLESIEEHKYIGSGVLEVAEESIAELGYAVTDVAA